MKINLTTTCLFICATVPVVLHIATGHIGDLSYYISTNDNSLRSIFGSGLFRIIWLATGNYTSVIVLWSVIIFFTLKSVIKYLDLTSKIIMFTLSAYLCFPSKESVILFYFLLITKVYSNANVMAKISILIATVPIRPMLVPQIVFHQMPIKLTSLIIFLFLLVFGCVVIFFGQTMATAIESTVILAQSYSYGYFRTAEQAGSTDYTFLENLPSMAPYDYLKTGLQRLFNPIWMLELNLTSKIYFAQYCLIVIYVIKRSLTAKGPYNRIFLSLMGSLISFMLLMPLTIVNAGSAVRYNSILIITILLFTNVPQLINKKHNKNA